MTYMTTYRDSGVEDLCIFQIFVAWIHRAGHSVLDQHLGFAFKTVCFDSKLNKWQKVPFRYSERGGKNLLLFSPLSLLLKRNWVRNLLRVMFKHYVICHGILSCASTLHLFRSRGSVLCLKLGSFEGNGSRFCYSLYINCVYLHLHVCIYSFYRI